MARRRGLRGSGRTAAPWAAGGERRPGDCRSLYAPAGRRADNTRGAAPASRNSSDRDLRPVPPGARRQLAGGARARRGAHPRQAVQPRGSACRGIAVVGPPKWSHGAHPAAAPRIVLVGVASSLPSGRRRPMTLGGRIGKRSRRSTRARATFRRRLAEDAGQASSQSTVCCAKPNAGCARMKAGLPRRRSPDDGRPEGRNPGGAFVRHRLPGQIALQHARRCLPRRFRAGHDHRDGQTTSLESPARELRTAGSGPDGNGRHRPVRVPAFLRTIDLGAGNTIVLMHEDGSLLRANPAAPEIGRRFRSRFVARGACGTQAGRPVIVSPIDGVSRFSASLACATSRGGDRPARREHRARALSELAVHSAVPPWRFPASARCSSPRSCGSSRVAGRRAGGARAGGAARPHPRHRVRARPADVITYWNRGAGGLSGWQGAKRSRAVAEVLQTPSPRARRRSTPS